jgi:hypothetical protein
MPDVGQRAGWSSLRSTTLIGKFCSSPRPPRSSCPMGCPGGTVGRNGIDIEARTASTTG